MLDVDIEKILPITEVKQNLEKIVNDVEGNDDLFVITQNGKPAAVIVGVKHLEVLTGMNHEDLMVGAGGSAAAAAAATATTTAATDSNNSQQANSAFINYGTNQNSQAQATTDDSNQAPIATASNSQPVDENTASPFEYPSSLSDQLKNLQSGAQPQTTEPENDEAPANPTEANTPIMTPPLEIPATTEEEQPAVVTSPLEEPILESEVNNPVEPVHPLSETNEETPDATPVTGQSADMSAASGTPATATNTLQPEVAPAQSQDTQSGDQAAAAPAGQANQEPAFGADANQAPDLNNLSSAQLNNLDTSGQQLKTPQQNQQQQ